jgi:hypothetical protein
MGGMRLGRAGLEDRRHPLRAGEVELAAGYRRRLVLSAAERPVVGGDFMLTLKVKLDARPRADNCAGW